MAAPVFRKPSENGFIHLETSPIVIKGILAATDLSPHSTKAVKVAARLVERLHARLYVLYAVAPELYVVESGTLAPQLRAVEMEAAQERLKDYTARIGEVRTVHHEELVLCGAAVECMREVVETKGIDLVVVVRMAGVAFPRWCWAQSPRVRSAACTRRY